eukprot:scpid21821/ scgid1822/ 
MNKKQQQQQQQLQAIRQQQQQQAIVRQALLSAAQQSAAAGGQVPGGMIMPPSSLQLAGVAGQGLDSGSPMLAASGSGPLVQGYGTNSPMAVGQGLSAFQPASQQHALIQRAKAAQAGGVHVPNSDSQSNRSDSGDSESSLQTSSTRQLGKLHSALHPAWNT